MNIDVKPFDCPDVETIVLSNLSDSQLSMDGGEKEEDLSILENVLFSDYERMYSMLDQDTALDILTELKNIKKENDPTIQCGHCEEKYTAEAFKMHVCLYNENHELIPVEEIDKQESDLEKCFREMMSLMKTNNNLIQDLIKKDEHEEKATNIECSKCCRKFIHPAGLERHWEKHIGEILEPSTEENPADMKEVTVCTRCDEVFGTDAEAWDHFLVHVEVTTITSYEQLDDYESPKKKPRLDDSVESSPSTPKPVKDQIPKLAEPFQSTRVSKVFQCEMCDSIFISAKAMLLHLSKHPPSLAFECKKCELGTMSVKEVLLHRRDTCVIFRDFRNPLKNFARVWVCNVCDEEFRGLEQLLEHRYKENHFFPRLDPCRNELKFVCERCLVTFSTAAGLIGHVNEKHLKKPKVEVDSVPETSERIKKTQDLQRGGSHQTSSRPRQYLCEVCGKSYTQSSHLWQHLRFHQGVKPFSCSVAGCGRKFTIRPDLNDHVRKCHTGERPYLCTICNKRFLTGSVFYQHRLIHRGERRYGCEECNKRFYRADALKNHMLIHTGEKPHSCTECGKTFRQRGDRDKHIKARHPNVEVAVSPKKERIKSYGRGRVKDNASLYSATPVGMPN